MHTQKNHYFGKEFQSKKPAKRLCSPPCKKVGMRIAAFDKSGTKPFPGGTTTSLASQTIQNRDRCWLGVIPMNHLIARRP